MGEWKQQRWGKGTGSCPQLVLWALGWPCPVGSNWGKEAQAVIPLSPPVIAFRLPQDRGMTSGQVSFFHQVSLLQRDWAQLSAINTPTAAGRERSLAQVEPQQLVLRPGSGCWEHAGACRGNEAVRRSHGVGRTDSVLNWWFLSTGEDVPRGPERHQSGNNRDRNRSCGAPAKRECS